MWRLLLGLSLGSVLGCTRLTVVRDIGGEAIEGRFVSELAYALYARAADAEARGDLAFALSSYEAAWKDDPDSVELPTRIGAIRCVLSARSAKGASFSGAEDAFEQALLNDPEYEPAIHEMARCALTRGRPDLAAAWALRAVELDPDRLETALLAIRALAASGQGPVARRWTIALVSESPRSEAALRAMRDLAQTQGDDPLAALARRQLAQVDATARRSRQEALLVIDAALVDGDVTTARRVALEAHVASAEVAARAAALGQAGAARDIAGLVTRADPSDATACIVLAVSADLQGDAAGVSSALSLGDDAFPPSQLATLLYAELLMRRVGDDAARLWLGAWTPPDSADDPLLTRVASRVKLRLGT